MAEPEEQSQSTLPNQQAQHAEEQKQSKIGVAGNVEFERLTRADLGPLPVIAQALDNQWAPRGLLNQAFQKGEITPDLDKKLRKAVRSEYIRSLINGQHVILDRAYVYNSAAVTQDYVGKQRKQNPMREVFKDFLEKKVLVPFLLGEKTPVDSPRGGLGVTPFRPTNAFSQWQEVCQEVRPRCFRLSWNDQENDQRIRQQLTQRSNMFAMSLAALDTDLLLKDFGLDPSAKAGFRQRLIEVVQFCLELTAQDKPISREAFYKRFVVAGENTVERRYDRSKPFAAELKQLFDLRHNCNLPDVLNGYLITPVDSLSRITLQEFQRLVEQPDVQGQDLVEILQRTAFDLVQQGLNLPSMDILSLQDVAQIRRMDEWTEYMNHLKWLLDHPLEFADGGAQHVYESYTSLTKRITELVANQEGKKNLLTTWTPTVEISIGIAGAVLSMLLTPAGPIFVLIGGVAVSVAGGTVPVVGKLIIRDIKKKRTQHDLTTSIDFLRCNLKDAEKQWGDIRERIRKLPGFREEVVPMQSKEIGNPTLNHPSD